MGTRLTPREYRRSIPRWNLATQIQHGRSRRGEHAEKRRRTCRLVRNELYSRDGLGPGHDGKATADPDRFLWRVQFAGGLLPRLPQQPFDPSPGRTGHLLASDGIQSPVHLRWKLRRAMARTGCVRLPANWRSSEDSSTTETAALQTTARFSSAGGPHDCLWVDEESVERSSDAVRPKRISPR